MPFSDSLPGIDIRKASKKKSIRSKEDLYRLHQEKVNRFRNVHRIHAKGSDIPDPIDSWDRLQANYGVSEDVLAVLRAAYDKPTPVQMQTLPLLLEKRETLICAPTGSGKNDGPTLYTL